MPVAPGVPAGWPYGAMPVLCLLSLISRNSPKQLGMVSPELLAVTRSALPSPLCFRRTRPLLPAPTLPAMWAFVY